jgi:hypothetical protein
VNRIARQMPSAEDRAPLPVLNRIGHGIRTVIVWSCEWQPAKASERGSAMDNAHMAHHRQLGLPRADYAKTLFGEGPWMGPEPAWSGPASSPNIGRHGCSPRMLTGTECFACHVSRSRRSRRTVDACPRLICRSIPSSA